MPPWDKNTRPIPPPRPPRDPNAPPKKILFATIGEAKASLGRDALATVRRGSKVVFVCTSEGSGAFSTAEWDRWDLQQPGPQV